MEYPRSFLEQLFRTMLRIHACEESFVEPIISGEIRCPVHLYTGQEAVATGVCAALEERDYVLGTHRSHGHYLAKGGDLDGLVAEVFCRETGCARGRGGSMHVLAPERGMLGAAPIVAGTVALAVGAAMASVIRDDDRVSVAFFGDGAVGEGVVYESMNLAALRRLPVLFVCENNLYSTHLRITECRPTESIYRIAEAFEISSRQVDGNDVLAIFEAASNAVSWCRGGRGPYFLECKTYRQRGHVGPDDNIQGTRTDIRPSGEVAQWTQRDPIATFAAYLEQQGQYSAEELDAIRGEVAAEVEHAVAAARQSRFPDEKELEHHVFG